jgi:diacylglycerol kinase family enzyme
MFMGSRRLILNPVSGAGDHADYVRRRAEARGFDVVETEGEGDGVALARAAAEDGVAELAVCGGDGTVNEALRGLEAAGALGEVTFGVVPAGTANLLAGNVGIRGLDHGLEVIDAGDVRTVDVGVADGEPFLVSCIAGFPADASVAASNDLKERFGTLAFLVTGVQEAIEFDGLDIALEAEGEAGVEHWEGEALCVLVGNARKFVEEGGQADVEDGLFDVAVVERMPAGNLVAEALAHRLLGRGTEGVAHFRASSVDLRNPQGAPITFSRDGELDEHEALSLSVRPRALDLRVGRDYTPDPDGDG